MDERLEPDNRLKVRGRWRWTEADDEIVRAAFAKGGIKAVFATFPLRSKACLYKRAHTLGLRKFRYWTAEEDEIVRTMWGECGLDEIAAKLKRTPRGIHTRAVSRLGLPSGCPDGYESVTAAAKRMGYDPASFKRLLSEADVDIQEAYAYRDEYTLKRCARRRKKPSKGGKKKRTMRNMIVRTIDADAAVAYRLSTETLFDASCRRSMCPSVLRDRLIAAGLKPPAKKKAWRIPTEDIDEALRLHEERSAHLELVVDAARRVGVKYTTLSLWLKRAGVVFGRKGVPRDVINRVVADRRKRETLRAAAHRLKLPHSTLIRWMKEAGVPVVKGGKFGFLPEVINRVVREQREKQANTRLESLKSAAARIGTTVARLTTFMKKHGFTFGHGFRGLPPETYDEVVIRFANSLTETETVAA